jgi:hypothetical protein
VTTALGIALVVPAALINRVAATTHARLGARVLGPARVRLPIAAPAPAV